MELRFDKTIYDKRALLKTAYHFTDRVYLHLSQDESAWIVSWTLKDGTAIQQEEFENELIAQSLRLQLAQDSADIRRILLSRAMASTLIELPPEGVPSQLPQDTQTASGEDDILRGWYE